MPIEMVLGFLFDSSDTDAPRIALIKKTRPSWQKGKLNGLGGHIMPGETPLGAMIREFTEEANALVTSWREFCTICEGSNIIHCFSSEGYYHLRSFNDEDVNWYKVNELYAFNVVEAVRWLIPLAQTQHIMNAMVVYEVPIQTEPS